ncbi:MAG: ATP-dependent metallopeptidase FtsH/Yme1/Tma family protein, partial [Oscillospiraceae bacterium]|nr:ATP-dependent metallopeptidase FtsH/Yme1/Tma family protein [Oscillospiraceae bacterium]
MNTKKQNQKPFILFSLILLLVIFLINAYVLPMLTEPNVVTTDYVSFLQQVDNNEVAYAEVGSDTIDYVLTKDLPADFDTSSTEVSLPSSVTVYETTRIEDQDLANRLLAAGVKTQGVKASSPSLFTTLLMSFFPFILIMAFYYFMSRQISKRMGGGGLGGSSLKFGKSTAKIYVPEEDDRKTFADVAGQEEAKASLNEVVDFLHNP